MAVQPAPGEDTAVPSQLPACLAANRLRPGDKEAAMADVALKALEFGVLGLCAITLILVSQVLLTKQKREGTPRKGIVRAS